MANKRFFWLKLKEDFFQQKAMKKLRRMDRGEVLTIIYLKMQLASLRNGGVIAFEGLGDSLEEELALQLDEQESDVREIVAFLIRCGLMEQIKGVDTYVLPSAIENTGSESDSAARMRALRGRTVSQCDARERTREDTEQEQECGAASPHTHPHFVPPTLEEVTAYIQERGSKVNPQSFIDFYASKGWMVGKNQMKDWKAACRRAENWSQWDKQPETKDRNRLRTDADYGDDDFFKQ